MIRTLKYGGQNFFMEVLNDVIRKNLIEMFASIEVFLHSELFVGTYSSNPGLFVGMLIDERMVGMDYEKWLIL